MALGASSSSLGNVHMLIHLYYAYGGRVARELYRRAVIK